MKTTTPDLLLDTLTVDPGNVTAWAYWNGNEIPENTGHFSVHRNSTLEEHTEQMWTKFSRIINKFHPTHCYIEGVEVWGGSMKSSIASKTGSLFKLAFLIGGYCRICQFEGTSFTILYPSRWKGQLNDGAIIKRVYRAIKKEYPNIHTYDAVAMGLHLMGVL